MYELPVPNPFSMPGSQVSVPHVHGLLCSGDQSETQLLFFKHALYSQGPAQGGDSIVIGRSCDRLLGRFQLSIDATKADLSAGQGHVPGGDGGGAHRAVAGAGVRQSAGQHCCADDAARLLKAQGEKSAQWVQWRELHQLSNCSLGGASEMEGKLAMEVRLPDTHTLYDARADIVSASSAL